MSTTHEYGRCPECGRRVRLGWQGAPDDKTEPIGWIVGRHLAASGVGLCAGFAHLAAPALGGEGEGEKP